MRTMTLFILVFLLLTLALFVAGVARAQLTMSNVGEGGFGTTSAGGCSGTIDLSTGCTQPMFGGVL